MGFNSGFKVLMTLRNWTAMSARQCCIWESDVIKENSDFRLAYELGNTVKKV